MADTSNSFGWQSIFDFRNTKDVKEAITLLGNFGDVYQDLIDDSKKLKEAYSKNMKSVIDTTKKLNEEAKKLSPVTEQGKRSIVEMSGRAEVLSASYKELNGKIVNVNQNMQRLTQEKQKVNAKAKEAIKLQKEEERLTAKLALAESGRAKNVAILREQIRKKNAEMKKAAQEALGLISVYQKETQKLIDLRKRYKDVALQYGENSRQAKRLRKEVVALDAQLKRIDRNVGQHYRTIGKYNMVWGQLGATFMRVGGALGFVGVLYGLVAAMRNALRTVIQFDKEMVNLAAISGQSRDEIRGLEMEIRRVASTSINTANDVAKTATALKTLGQSNSQIIDLLEPVNNLSIALQATADEAGELLVQTLNAFGKTSDSAGEFADIIAKMRTSTALDFERIKDSLGFIAPVARAVGLDLAETGAIIGVLVDNGIKAARAGRLMSSSFSRLNKMGVTLNQALEMINTSTDKTKTASELFGTEAFALGLILADNTKKTNEYAESFRNAEGALEDLTERQLQSLSAQLKILSSNWTEFVLAIENGQGALGIFIKEAITGLSRLVKFLTPEVATAFDEGLAFGSKLKIENEKLDKEVKMYEKTLSLLASKIRELQSEINNSENISVLDAQKNAAQIEEYTTQVNKTRGVLAALYQRQLEVAEATEDEEEAIEENKKSRKGLIETINEEIKVLQERKKVAGNEEEILRLNIGIRTLERQKKALDDLGEPTKNLKRGFKLFAAELDPIPEKLDKIGDAAPKIVNKFEFAFMKLGAFFEEFGKEIEEAFMGFANALEGFLIAQEDARIARYEKQIEQLNEQKEKDIAIAGENADARAAIESNYAEKQRKIEEKIRKERNKSARREKAVAVAQSIINTVSGVVAAISPPPLGAGPVAGLPLASVIGAFGAIKTGLIASTPIPEYFKGTPPEGHIGGLASVAERGREIIQTPDKRTLLQDRPAVMNLPKGTKVFTNAETERLLSDKPIDVIKHNEGTANQINHIIEGLKRQDLKLLAHEMRLGGYELGKMFKDSIQGLEVHTWNTGARGLRKDIRRGNTTLIDVNQENKHG